MSHKECSVWPADILRRLFFDGRGLGGKIPLNRTKLASAATEKTTTQRRRLWRVLPCHDGIRGAFDAEACVWASAPATRVRFPGGRLGRRLSSPHMVRLAVPWNRVRVPAPWSWLDMVRNPQPTNQRRIDRTATMRREGIPFHDGLWSFRNHEKALTFALVVVVEGGGGFCAHYLIFREKWRAAYPCLTYLFTFFESFLKILAQGHLRSGHQVRSSESVSS